MEKERKNVLLEWAKLIKREDPDIIIGYNTFGFDWHFLLDRADELRITNEFLETMSRNKSEKKPKDMIVKSKQRLLVEHMS